MPNSINLQKNLTHPQFQKFDDHDLYRLEKYQILHTSLHILMQA